MSTGRWVVGVDGSDDSRTALAWAAAQAAGRDVTIDALCTWRAPILPSDAIGQPALLMDWSVFEAELGRRVDEIVDSVRTASGMQAIEARVIQGRAAHELIEAGRDADLLVVGSRGKGGLGGVVLGSVSRQCATHATVPVAVVPAIAAIGPAHRVVVGFDGSKNARAAVRWALDFCARDPDAEITVVRAVELAPWMDEESVRDRFGDEVDQATADFEAALAEVDPDGRTRHTLKLQDARQALSEAAAGADLVALGARGRGRFGAALLGSVSSWMLHGVSHPTVIVPEPRD